MHPTTRSHVLQLDIQGTPQAWISLERVAERIDKISVFGGLDQVFNSLVTLR